MLEFMIALVTLGGALSVLGALLLWSQPPRYRKTRRRIEAQPEPPDAIDLAFAEEFYDA